MVTIFEQMLEKAGNAGIVEGSFIADHMLAVAAELERVMDAAEYLPNRIFPTLAEGDDLTLVATNFGTERHGAQYASAEITVTGTAGTAGFLPQPEKRMQRNRRGAASEPAEKGRCFAGKPRRGVWRKHKRGGQAVSEGKRLKSRRNCRKRYDRGAGRNLE